MNVKEQSKKKLNICIRLLPAQIEKLDDEAEKRQLNRSDLVRVLIDGMPTEENDNPS